ncbi:hypothetical protein CW298_2576 [Salmonella enterica subsp. enterica serovar Muenchen]|uniref:Uncharacterized protein n=3 Tax=Salmonella enterica I TaxID=59201 RepID=A0A6C6Z0J8_SALPB|nr:hypothetical protein SPAB_01223 [Salmonella enterica subsp. enterica serovar Paratyphi B str. SPB7]AET54156.1 hypothetical protein SPUL_1822 [Salmonella enterica subsp. enterica serovar Gallinarum/Pullorum str. RKS5078]AGU64655.1 hypothetical protein SPUCDC_1808 [Salmonella enterica subsp. enterica serovar Gallinarum/Pullorum str. CDC1983-67]ATD45056.1 hypothetical protein FORC51_2840 [Salmonella enterica]AUC49773.1 Uncharacterized protein YfaD [Salmonella enterica subsp. enterica serovar Ty
MYNGGECRVAIASMKVLAFLYFYTLYTGVNAFYSHSYF